MIEDSVSTTRDILVPKEGVSSIAGTIWKDGGRHMTTQMVRETGNDGKPEKERHQNEPARVLVDPAPSDADCGMGAQCRRHGWHHHFAGNVTSKQLPSSSLLLTTTRPLWASATALTRLNPKPEPVVERLGSQR